MWITDFNIFSIKIFMAIFASAIKEFILGKCLNLFYAVIKEKNLTKEARYVVGTAFSLIRLENAASFKF